MAGQQSVQSLGQATPELTYPYLKLRKDFGRQPQFVEDHPRIQVDILPDKRQKKKLKRMVNVDKSVQACPQLAEDEVNTVRAEYVDSGMYHSEGGWPRDVNVDDPEMVARYRKKLEKDEGFVNSLTHMSKTMEKYIKQNNAMDIYGDFFKSPWRDIDIHRSPPSANVVQVYRDACPIRRSVAKITWAPDNLGRFGVAHCPFEFDLKLRESPTEAFLWNLDNSNRPESLIRNISHICDMKYHPKDFHSIIGGCFNGSVCTWDTRAGVNPQQVSPYEISHKDLCKNVIWVNSKTGSDFFSSGLDGQVIWWDNRNLSEVVESTWLDPEKGNCRPEMAQGCTVLEYESTLPTKFMAGTENGNVMIMMRKAKNPTDKLNHMYKAHYGPVRGLQRNPVFIKNFLTVGDFTCRIFAEDCKESAVLWTAPTDTYYTHGMWIPTRASSFVCSRMDGYCDFWDMLMDPVRPHLKVKVSDEMLNCVAPSDNGKFVAVGTEGGIVCLLKLAESMTTSEKNDKPALAAIFERESRREKFLEQRNREIRLKKRDKEKAEADEKKRNEMAEKGSKEKDQETSAVVVEVASAGSGGEESGGESKKPQPSKHSGSRPSTAKKYDAAKDLVQDPIAIAERDFFNYIQKEMDEKGVNAFPEKQAELEKMTEMHVEGEKRDTSGSLEITEEELATFAKIAKEEDERMAKEEAEKLAREERAESDRLKAIEKAKQEAKESRPSTASSAAPSQVQSQVQTPVESPAQSPAQSPVQSPAQSPVQSPGQSSGEDDSGDDTPASIILQPQGPKDFTGEEVVDEEMVEALADQDTSIIKDLEDDDKVELDVSKSKLSSITQKSAGSKSQMSEKEKSKSKTSQKSKVSDISNASKWTQNTQKSQVGEKKSKTSKASDKSKTSEVPKDKKASKASSDGSSLTSSMTTQGRSNGSDNEGSDAGGSKGGKKSLKSKMKFRTPSENIEKDSTSTISATDKDKDKGKDDKSKSKSSKTSKK